MNTPLVSVIITCYNQAIFLTEAIESVRGQSCRHFEILIVDDGSTDNTSEIAASFPEVYYIKQPNQGLSAARNTGIRESKGRYLVFLDADDKLDPLALEINLNGFHIHPQCAMVFGAHRHISTSGEPISPPKVSPVYQNYYQALLRGNFIAMHATVMYRRDVLETIGYFNTDLAACEDYDLYLRIARKLPIYGHDAVIAEYRKHDTNMSNHAGRMLKWALTVLQSQWSQVKKDLELRKAYRSGIENWRAFYAPKLCYQVITNMLKPGKTSQAINDVIILARYASLWCLRHFLRKISRSVSGSPKSKKVDWGSFRHTPPIAEEFDSNPELALSINRYYIESSLYRHRQCMRGSILEISDKNYSRGLCDERTSEVTFVSFDGGDSEQRLFSDLKRFNDTRSGSFDCIILLQVLNSIYDTKALLRSLYKLLKPGGVLLTTVAGIGPLGKNSIKSKGYWYFTTVSARQLFAEVFSTPGIAVEGYGNVLTAVSSLYDLPAKELFTEELDFHDSAYPLIIAVRALKPVNAKNRSKEGIENVIQV